MFEKIVGHERIKKMLEEEINSNTVSHAYLFYGKEGIGKKMLAIEFAKVLLKTENLETCVDYKYIEKEPEKTEISVEQIRTKIINDVYIAPAIGEYKVYIINDAHLMNGSGQNAMLKTLEEPPKYVVIILITDSVNSLLTTILSRTKQVMIDSLNNEEVKSIVKEKTKEILPDNLLEYASGSVKKALEQKDELEVYSKVNSFYNAIKRKEKLEAQKQINEISLKDKASLDYMQHIAFTNKDYSKVAIIERAKRRMEQNANEEMVKQALCIKLLEEE